MAASLDHPLLTVGVPTYNGAGHLSQALQSILSQQGVAFELIVSDDRSTDDTIDVVRKTACESIGSRSTPSAWAWPVTGTARSRSLEPLWPPCSIKTM